MRMSMLITKNGWGKTRRCVNVSPVTRLKQIKLDVYIDIRHSVLLLYQVKNILILDTPYWYQYYLFHYRTYCVTSVPRN